MHRPQQTQHRISCEDCSRAEEEEAALQTMDRHHGQAAQHTEVAQPVEVVETTVAEAEMHTEAGEDIMEEEEVVVAVAEEEPMEHRQAEEEQVVVAAQVDYPADHDDQLAAGSRAGRECGRSWLTRSAKRAAGLPFLPWGCLIHAVYII